MKIRKTLLVLLFGGTLGGFFLREQQRGTLERFDRAHREFLKANASPDGRSPGGDSSVVFARLDDFDQSKRVFDQWPLGDADWQVVLQNLPGYTPRTVALGVPLRFEKASPGLEASAKGLPGLVAAVDASTSKGEGQTALPESVPVLTVTGSPSHIPEFKSIKQPVLPAGAAPDSIDLSPKDQRISMEGDWCRVPMLARMGDKVVPTLALRALLEWARIPISEVEVQPGVGIKAGKSLHIPIDDAGFFRYYLSLAPEVPALNADDFVLAREQAFAELPEGDPRRSVLEGLKSSLLWFGPDNVGVRILKLPNGTPVSPAELTARAIAAIQTDSYMRPLEPDFRWIPMAGTLVFCLWLGHWRKSRLIPGVFLAAAGLAGISLYLYRQDHLWVPLGPSLGVLGGTLVIALLLPSPRGREPSETNSTGTRKTVRTQRVEPATSPKPPPTTAPTLTRVIPDAGAAPSQEPEASGGTASTRETDIVLDDGKRGYL